MFLCRRRQCVEAGLHLTHISFARMFLPKMARNPWCSESSTRWVCSTSGKSSVRKGIRDSLKQTRKVALQIREKRSTKSLVSVDLSKHGIKNFPAFLGYWRFIIHLFSSWHLSQPQPICFGSFFFFGWVDFVFGQPKSAKYLSDGQVKWKKSFLPCQLQI